MKTGFVLILATCALLGCEQKPPADAGEAATTAQHANTNRAVLKAAGKAAKQIENKGEDRLKAADEAMKAGK